MTKEELREHCERQVQQFERVEKIMPVTMNDWKRYEEHKLILELLEERGTSDDCVSKKAVLDEINSMSNANPSYWNQCDVVDREDLIDGIQSLPSVTPTQRWIPVSERLPEESGNYLLYGKVVDYEENCVFIGEYDSDYEMFGYKEDIYDSEILGFLNSEFCEYNKVIAWQPLPQPYEEKRGSENG